MTITCIVEEIGNDLHDHLQSDVQKFISASLTLDESTDIGSTAQTFYISPWGDFQVSEELLAMVSSKERTMGCDIFEAVCDNT